MATDPKVMQKIDLSELERDSYHRWRRQDDFVPLPLATAMQLYELFLNSYSCEEITRINANKYPLGQVVDARMRYDWDKRRQEQLDAMFYRIEEKVVRVKNQAVHYLSDMLAAAHKLNGDKLQKFLMEGDPTILESFKLNTLKDYRELVNMFILLTGGSYNLSKNTNNQKLADQLAQVNVQGEVKHIHSVKENEQPKAGDLLKMIDDAEIVDGN